MKYGQKWCKSPPGLPLKYLISLLSLLSSVNLGPPVSGAVAQRGRRAGLDCTRNEKTTRGRWNHQDFRAYLLWQLFIIEYCRMGRKQVRLHTPTHPNDLCDWDSQTSIWRMPRATEMLFLISLENSRNQSWTKQIVN